MPFDALSPLETRVNPFSAIVLQAVDPKRVEAHKRQVIDVFAAHSSEKALLIQTGVAGWRYRLITPRNLYSVLYYYKAPKQVHRLAKRIIELQPNAIFTVEFFYADPILSVTADSQKIHLAIWENYGLIDIATTVKQKTWLDKLFHRQ